MGEKTASILIVSYIYPPMNINGAQRIVKFVKYLPQFGYKPIILTNNAYGSLPDDEANQCFRCSDLLGVVKSYIDFYQKKAKNDRRFLPIKKLSLWNQAIGLKSLLIPDAAISWYLPSILKGCQILNTKQIKIIYSSSPHETNHLVALKLKQKTGLPWIADLRDGWMFEPLENLRITHRIRRSIEFKLENEVIQAADRIITINTVIAEDIVKRYPSAQSKIDVIPNGYDSEDFSFLNDYKPTNICKIVHTGRLSLSRTQTSISGLIKALEGMKAKNDIICSNLKIVFIGSLSKTEIAEISHSSVSECFSLENSVSYKEALEEQLQADILLLITPLNAIGVSTSKLYEYLATGRPILALTHRSSSAARTICELGSGIVVEPDDVRGIQESIQTLYQQWEAGKLVTQVNPEVGKFERRELTRKLAEIMDGMIHIQRFAGLSGTVPSPQTPIPARERGNELDNII